MSVNELVQRWRDFAMQDVPKDYSERGLTQKYLRGDCAAGGAWDAADELEDVARTAWHPVSETPTEADAGGYMVDPSCVLIINDGGEVGMAPWWSVPHHVRTEYWARINDVVLLPPQSNTGEG